MSSMSLISKFLYRIHEKRNKRSFALNDLDIKIVKYLNKRRGFFVEVGANDGISQSNTMYLERYYKWRGLLVEPIPELAERCRINRPKCIVENCALVSSDFSNETIEMRYANLMSVVKGGMKDVIEEDLHIKKGLDVQNLSASYTVTVPARTLSSILEQHNINKIDLFSLDVEGYELEVLKGLDFQKHRPMFIVIEARYRDEIDSFIGNLYETIAELAHFDVLYKLRNNGNL